VVLHASLRRGCELRLGVGPVPCYRRLRRRSPERLESGLIDVLPGELFG